MKTFVVSQEVSRASLYFSAGDKLYLAELDVWDNEGGSIPAAPARKSEGAEVIDGFWSPVKAR
jgi:hypothetical protein